MKHPYLDSHYIGEVEEVVGSEVSKNFGTVEYYKKIDSISTEFC